MSKKRIIAIVTIIVLLFAAGISVGVFLYSRGTTQAADGSQVTDNQNQVADGNQSTATDGVQPGENTDNTVTNPDDNNENVTTPDNEDGEETENDETVENDNANANNEATNNNVAENTNNAANAGNANGNNAGVTTGTNVENVGETTITRVEEQERLVSEDFWDWWQPMTVSVVPTNVGVEIPKMDVKKTAITGFGGDYLVERSHDITYVIAVTNNEDEAAESIEITDRIPEKTVYVDESISDAYIVKEVDGKVVSENLETKKSTVKAEDTVIGVKWVVTIPANETVFVSFKVNVKETVLNENNEEVLTNGSIYNKAIANGQESNEVETSIIGIDVRKTATAVKRAGETEFTTPVGEVREGDVIEYTIVVTNTGSRDLSNVLLEETLIDIEITGLEVDGVSKAIAFDEETGKLIIGDLKCAKEATEESDAVEAGVAEITATYEVTYEVDIKGKGNEDGTIIPIYNKVYATGESVPDPKNPGEEPEEVEDNDDEIVPVAEDPRFEITKTATRVNRAGTEKDKYISPVGKVRPGDVVEYEIVITNTGNTTLTNILVTDTLSVKVDSYDGDLKEVDPETGVSTLKTIDSLASGKSATIKTYYTVKATDVTADETTIDNVATAKPTECDEKKDDEIVPVNPNVSVEGTKTWYAPDGYDVPNITINLLQNGKPFKIKVEDEDGEIKEVAVSITVSTSSVDETPSYIFTGLPKYKFVDGIYELDEDGNYVENEYTVSENEVKGFDSQQNGYDFVNTIKQEYISVSGTKTWYDNDDQDGKRPTSIYIQLYKTVKGTTTSMGDDYKVELKATGENNTWKESDLTYSFDDLPRYENGKIITYTVEEELDEVAKTYYTTEYDYDRTAKNGNVIADVTNTHTPETVVVQGTKTWNDNNNQDGIRPNSIVIQLYKTVDGTTSSMGDNYKVELKATGENNTWIESDLAYSFDNLPRYEGGKIITYTVEEELDEVAETYYTTEYDYDRTATNGNVTANVTNTHTPETVAVQGTKTWDDSNNQDGVRPSTITVNLFANNTKVDSITLPDANGNWSYKFENKPKYANGNKIAYTVEEELDEVAKTYYTTEYAYDRTATNGDVTANITNKHTPETVSVQGTKTWDDNNNKNGKRPSTITVKLLANNTKVDSITLPDANGNWSYKFENKPKYANGNKITYTVEEDAITDYTPTYTTTTATNGDVTINIKNTFSQDIKGQIITVEETELPLDVVFVLDISSSMLETDGDTKTRVQDMVEATNTAIKELMENANNRVSVVLFNSFVYELTDANQLKHYSSTGDYITYTTVTNNNNVGGRISFSNGNTVNVSTSYYGNGSSTNGAFKCGTYTQGGIKKATQIFASSDKGTITRKPVMILLTDGDPTHYDTKTTYNEYGTKYPGGDGIGRLRYVTAEYYAYTMKTMQNCKTSITGFYNKECEMYTVGINMQGAMAKALLKPSTTNINGLVNTSNISTDIFNTDDYGNKSSLSVVDADGVWRSGATYYKYQANRLYTFLTGSSSSTKITSDYINKAYTESNSGDIAENFEDIVNIITETRIINITAENYDSDRIIKLEGFNPNRVNINNIFSLKITRDNGTAVINTSDVTQTGDYIQYNSTDGYYYLVLTNLTGKVNVELKYHK